MVRLTRIGRWAWIWLVALAAAPPTGAAELATLTPATWEEFAPQGKEVDCIYGDIVLRNEYLVAVIAQPIAGRNANMTVRDTGGCLIDFTTRHQQNDQLSAFYPLGAGATWRGGQIEPAPSAAIDSHSATQAHLQSPRVQFTCLAEATPERPTALVRYTLADGDRALTVETVYTNTGDQPRDIVWQDELRADISFEKSPDGSADFFWFSDRWYGQAYGLISSAPAIASVSNNRTSTLKYEGADLVLTVPAGGQASLVRHLFVGPDSLAVQSLRLAQQQVATVPFTLHARGPDGEPVPGAELRLRQGEAGFGWGRTDAQGDLTCLLPAIALTGEVAALGRGVHPLAEVAGEQTVALPLAGFVRANIVDEAGGPIACKVQFRGLDGTPNPEFGHASGDRGVQNLVYNEQGRFVQAVTPGRYECLISHGPEFDALFRTVEVAAGQTVTVEGILLRTLQTPGWISTDFHSHSSPSGDNTSSQLGRVLNLLCEHLEFAPCTEHNRLSSYAPHLAVLGSSRRMATCVGMELTGSLGDVNHQNAFPLVREDRKQDGGGPQADADPEIQIARLALWDNRSDKLVQQNHPDIGHLFFDKNGDGQPDAGFAGALGHMDVIEVHPPHTIFQGPTVEYSGKAYNNTIVNWLQLLNQGYRLPGVVNTDAHYNFHGSGFLRMYLASGTDDPAEIQTLEMVHAAEAGRIIMTSGPYLEVLLEGPAAASRDDSAPGGSVHGGPGDDVSLPGGSATLRVRVQCPNWFDIDRVQVFLNGRPEPSLNFTRETTPERFTGGVIKFDQALPLVLSRDTHVIVAAAAERSTLGPVMGPDHERDMPIAVSNPIFVDYDGGGFQANGDTLDAPLPVVPGRRPQ